MINLFKFLVYRKFRLADASLIEAGFTEKERALEYVNLLKKKYPCEDYYIKEVEKVRNS